MTTQELLSIPPSELAQLSDSELAEKLSPLFPSVRSEYVGPKTASIVIDGKVRSKKTFESQLARLAQIVGHKSSS